MNPESEFRLADPNVRNLKFVYRWLQNEPDRDHYSCRPVKNLVCFKDWLDKVMMQVNSGEIFMKILMREGSSLPLGRISGFDFNPRNRSMEFGYYLPLENRSRGFGSMAVALFTRAAFEEEEFQLNKLYATTSSNNIASIKVLEKSGFTLDGRNREHYWIGEDRYDQLVYSILRSEWQQSAGITDV